MYKNERAANVHLGDVNHNDDGSNGHRARVSARIWCLRRIVSWKASWSALRHFQARMGKQHFDYEEVRAC